MAKNNIELQVPQNSILRTNEKTGILILIVEDDLMNQILIKKFLEKRFDTIITDSSDKVPEILKSNKIGIILMDISIQGKMNGLELTTVLKRSREFSHIPVIAITAHVFAADKVNALEAGCDNYLAKPFSKQSLIDMIYDCIGK
jgi:CheY-like chemotaxis protein